MRKPDETSTRQYDYEALTSYHQIGKELGVSYLKFPFNIRLTRAFDEPKGRLSSLTIVTRCPELK